MEITLNYALGRVWCVSLDTNDLAVGFDEDFIVIKVRIRQFPNIMDYTLANSAETSPHFEDVSSEGGCIIC